MKKILVFFLLISLSAKSQTKNPHLAAEIAIKGVLDTAVCEIANP